MPKGGAATDSLMPAGVVVTAAPVAPADTHGRVIALDLLRLLAALQMVQGHTLDAVLGSGFRHGSVHAVWLSLRGLTSVAFLFAAGLAYHLATLRRVSSSASTRAARARRLRRAVWLILLGYALHLPIGLLGSPDPSATARMLQSWLAVDVLQCIGVSLLVLELLAVVFPTRRKFEVACVSCAVLALAAAGQFAPVNSGVLGGVLQSYVTDHGGSIFPIFPWSAHVFLGVALGGFVLSPHRQSLRLAIVSAALIGFSLALQQSALASSADHLRRLGAVVLATALLSLVSPWAAGWPARIWRLSRETLFIYVFHIVLVYGDGVGLSAWVGPSLSPWAAIALAVVVLALSFGGALAYARLRARLRWGRPPHDPAGLAGSTATG